MEPRLPCSQLVASDGGFVGRRLACRKLTSQGEPRKHVGLGRPRIGDASI